MPTERTTLLVDIGNTRLKWRALADAEGSLVDVTALPHAADGFERALRTGLQARPWMRICIANVGPPAVLARLERACSELLPGVPLQHARSVAQCGDLRNGYDVPSQLGVDRFLALLAACERWPRQRVLLASIGSAVTLDLLEPGGAHAGGLIAPSPAAMRRALAVLAPQLALDAAVGPDTFARDTAAGIASGCTRAVIALIEQSVSTATVNGEAPLLVLSGGGAAELAPRLATRSHVWPYLVLDGLGRYARLES